MITPPPSPRPTAMTLDSAMLHERVARQIAARLQAAADAPGTEAEMRLQRARERALEVARARRSAHAVPALATTGPELPGAGRPRPDRVPRWWAWFGGALPLAALIGGLLLIQHSTTRSRIAAAAQVDAALLVDELPPGAYSDPAFLEYLNAQRP